MLAIPQIEPVTSLQRRYREIFQMLENGPVILTHNGRPAAVMVSVSEWTDMAAELEECREHRPT